MSFNPWGQRTTADWHTPASTLIAQGSEFYTSYGFTGQDEAEAAGLIHMGGRIYDPRLGRFVQADPYVQNPTDTQTFNRYSYVRNNPLRYTDPTGYDYDTVIVTASVGGDEGYGIHLSDYGSSFESNVYNFSTVLANNSGGSGSGDSIPIRIPKGVDVGKNDYGNWVISGNGGLIIIGSGDPSALYDFFSGKPSGSSNSSDNPPYVAPPYDMPAPTWQPPPAPPTPIPPAYSNSVAQAPGTTLAPSINSSNVAGFGIVNSTSTYVLDNAAKFSIGETLEGLATWLGGATEATVAYVAVPVILLTGSSAGEHDSASDGTKNAADKSPDVNPSDIAGKTTQEIDKAAKDAGLLPKGPDPMGGKGSYVDPVTGEQRVLVHPDADCGPHCHVNDAAGNRLDVNGNIVPPESPDAHLPLGR